MSYHEGERAVQHRAGVGRGDWGSASVGPDIPAVAAAFLQDQRLIVLGAADAGGAAWATVLTGPAGFATAVDERTVVIDAAPGLEDPLADTLTRATDVGLLAIDPTTRRRLRINGRSHSEGHRLLVRTDQVYANCPKYIQARELLPDGRGHGPAAASRAHVGPELTGEQQRWLKAADTFFIATYATGRGADVSHRGGNPGFVRVQGAQHVTWPDYAGNSMYMTLGNLELTPRAGLLFVDWERGHTLQLTGRARTDWDPGHAAKLPGAQRLVELDVEGVVQIDDAVPLRWRFGDHSRHNPPVGRVTADFY